MGAFTIVLPLVELSFVFSFQCAGPYWSSISRKKCSVKVSSSAMPLGDISEGTSAPTDNEGGLGKACIILL